MLRAAHSRNCYPLIRISGSLRFPVMLIKGAENKVINPRMCKHTVGHDFFSWCHYIFAI